MRELKISKGELLLRFNGKKDKVAYLVNPVG
jgi:hypothetical protein